MQGGGSGTGIVGSVTILLCTRNGHRFLAEQLGSIERQTHTAWRVLASDDHSTDATADLLGEWQERWDAERLAIRTGPGRGFCANFLSLACDPGIESAYFAYCDQDDVWDVDKLEVAVDWLSKIPVRERLFGWIKPTRLRGLPLSP